MKTIKLLDQLRASREIYERELKRYDQLSDAELARALVVASDSTLTRVNAHVPIVDDLDQRMLGAVESGALDMATWHCGTTHCRAGWAITFGGDDGKKLESLVGPEIAARLIYEASTGRIAPDVYASNEDAIADIRRCAGVEVKS